MARSKDDTGILDHSADEYQSAPPPPIEAEPPEPARAPPLDDEQNARLRDLRVRHQTYGSPLDDGEKSEMDTLGKQEAEAAGHFAPDPVAEGDGPTRDSDGVLWVNGELASILRMIAARVPALHDLDARLALLQRQVADLRIRSSGA